MAGLLRQLRRIRWRNETLILLIAIALVFTAFVVALGAFKLWELRSSARAEADDASAQLTRAIATDIQQDLKNIDSALRMIAGTVKESDGAMVRGELIPLARLAMASVHDGVIAFNIFDPDGRLIATSRKNVPIKPGYADRDYFRAQKDSRENRLYISAPVTARIGGESVVVLSRKIETGDGQFAGVVAAGVRLRYFTELFKKINIGEGNNITLIRTDGVILTRWPFKQEYVGLNIRHADLFKYLEKSPVGQFTTYAKTDGVQRSVAYHAIGGSPLVIGVGRSLGGIYRTWHDYAGFVVIAMVLVIGCGGLLIFALLRSLAKLAHSDETARVALDNMSHGLCMFDSDERLVMCNDQYKELYNIPPGYAEPGIRFRDMLELRKKAGFFPPDPEKFVMDLRRSLERTSCYTKIFNTADGRVIAITHRTLEGGGWVAIHEDITELRRAHQAIKEGQRQMWMLVDSVSDYAIYWLDLDHRIVRWNKGTENLFGYPAEELSDLNIERLFLPEETGKRPKEITAAAIRNGRYRSEGWRVRKDGSVFWANAIVQPIYDPNGELDGMAVVMSDATKQRNENVELRQAVEFAKQMAGSEAEARLQLEKANQELSTANANLQKFASIVAHDLRAPLKRVDAFASILREEYGDKFDEDGLEMMSRMTGGVARMQAMLGALLDYSRCNSKAVCGKTADLAIVVSDVIENCDFKDVVISAGDPSSRESLEQGCSFNISLDGIGRVHGDPILLGHVFQNLISNSIKFRSDAPVRIDIVGVRRGADVEITMTDNGIGIEAEYADKVFEMFCRLHDDDEYEGTGIGLSVCQKIIQDHGGEIAVDKDYRGGTRIVMMLRSADVAYLDVPDEVAA